MAIDRKLYTIENFEQFLALSENRDRLFELIDGEIVEKMPTQEHAFLKSFIAWLMNNVVIPNDLGLVLTNARFQLEGKKHNARLPDISFQANISSPTITEGAIPTMPDIAVEIQSPDDSEKEVEAKARYYIANGTRLAWVVFPRQRTIDVYRANGDKIILTENDILSGEEVLPGFSVPVSSIFARIQK